jgi:amino acid transporter
MVQVTGAPSVDYALAAMILAASSITHPGYTPTEYQTFLLTVFIMIIHACISSMPTLWIARFNSFGSTLNLMFLFIVIVMIPASVTGTADMPKFHSSSEVWSVQNATDWPDGIAVLMSFIAIIWTMSGYGTPPRPFSSIQPANTTKTPHSISQKNAPTPTSPLPAP